MNNQNQTSRTLVGLGVLAVVALVVIALVLQTPVVSTVALGVSGLFLLAVVFLGTVGRAGYSGDQTSPNSFWQVQASWGN